MLPFKDVFLVTCCIGLLNLHVVGSGAVHGEGQVHGHEVEDEEVAVGPDEVPTAIKIRSVLRTNSMWLFIQFETL